MSVDTHISEVCVFEFLDEHILNRLAALGLVWTPAVASVFAVISTPGETNHTLDIQGERQQSA